jgi:hypothetical protein
LHRTEKFKKWEGGESGRKRLNRELKMLVEMNLLIERGDGWYEFQECEYRRWRRFHQAKRLSMEQYEDIPDDEKNKYR